MSVSPPTIRCPVCVDSVTSRWGSREGQAIFECGACGLTFFDLSRFTAHDYRDYYRYTEGWSETDLKYEVEVRRRRTVRQLRRLASMVAGRRLLDIGAGPGYFCRIALDEGWDAAGVEISGRAVEIGRDRLGVSYIDLEAAPAVSVDVVCCRHVVEHVADPLGLLRTLRRVLKPGGVLVLHAPHQEPLSFLLRNRLLRRPDTLCALYLPDHVLGFTASSLSRVAKRAGFDTLSVEATGKWSAYSDPFFFRHHLRQRTFLALSRHVTRQLVDSVGARFGRGDWVVGHFRKASDEPTPATGTATSTAARRRRARGGGPR
jgi:SAM-dependent methyltransferase